MSDDKKRKSFPRPGDFRTFTEARRYVRSLGLKNYTEWQAFVSSRRRPSFIPSTPHRQYKDEWISTSDWLGLEPKPRYLSFAKARALARKKKFANQAAFRQWATGAAATGAARPGNLPQAPQRVYAGKGWKGWADFLGNRHHGKRGRQFKPFHLARAIARGLQLKGWKEWRAWAAGSKRPADIPARPAAIYQGKGWVNVADWLGYRARFPGARYSSKRQVATRTANRHSRKLHRRHDVDA